MLRYQAPPEAFRSRAHEALRLAERLPAPPCRCQPVQGHPGDGEICVRSPAVMAGYWRRPEENAAAFTEDGFFRTGDIGSFDPDGYLRLKEQRQ